MATATLIFTGKPVCAFAGKLLAIIVVATYALSTRAQGINNAQNAQKNDATVNQHSGAGIRAGLAVVPDGWLVTPAEARDFKGQRDSPIDPATFKLMYGALQIDTTRRVTQFATVTKDGFSLDNARVPPGRHRLTLQVLDGKQRVAERELRLEVE